MQSASEVIAAGQEWASDDGCTVYRCENVTGTVNSNNFELRDIRIIGYEDQTLYENDFLQNQHKLAAFSIEG